MKALAEQIVDIDGSRFTAAWSRVDGGSRQLGAKKQKTNVIGAQSPGMVQNVGVWPGGIRDRVFGGFGEYLVDEVTRNPYPS